MKSRLLLLLASALLAQTLLAQHDTSWTGSYNGPANAKDRAYALAIDRQRNTYVAGESQGVGTSYDYVTVKYDSAGKVLWSARYDGPGSSWDIPQDIAVDTSGNVYVTGYSWGSSKQEYDYATIKYTPKGDTAWVRRYNGKGSSEDWAYAIALDGAGGVYVTGASDIDSGTAIFQYALTTIKYSEAGDTLWIRQFTGSDSTDSVPSAMGIDTEGNVYIAGYNSVNDPSSVYTSSDYVTVRYSPDGDTLWTRVYDSPSRGMDEARALDLDDAGNVYVTGRSGKTSMIDYDFATIKYDRDGKVSWVARYDGPLKEEDEAAAIAVDRSGNVYVTGLTSGTGWDWVTVKYDALGDTAWVRTFNGKGNGPDVPHALALDQKGNVCVTGYAYSATTYDDYATIMYDGDGNEIWSDIFPGPGAYDDEATAIGVDPTGNICIAGAIRRLASSDDMVTICYRPTVVAVDDPSVTTAGHFALLQNYPNPFNPATRIGYDLATESRVKIQVWNVLGQIVATLVEGVQQAGYRSLEWNAESAATGVYFCRLQAASTADPHRIFTDTKKMIVVR